MRVFIANFGRENYEWPNCRERSTVATMNEVDAQRFWDAGDREGYITSRMKGKTAAGLNPTRSVAARWYNLMTVVSETAGDIWIHRDGDLLWWTVSRDDPPIFEPKSEPIAQGRDVIVCHKSCEPWANQSRGGTQLLWRSLHPKSRDFLSTEATLQQLSPDYAAYALALINGSDLELWHSRSIWIEKNDRASSKFSEVRLGDVKQKAAYREAAERMATMAGRTANQANGQETSHKLKNKEMRFPTTIKLQEYIQALIDMQDGLCALTDLQMDFDERDGDQEFFLSLDRIDSDKHYEAGNLQIVCRFANRWKGAADDAQFRRLIEAVRRN